ncbi:MAG: alpha/beta hydrolase [Verrucomicrobiota bacterium]
MISISRIAVVGLCLGGFAQLASFGAASNAPTVTAHKAALPAQKTDANVETLVYKQVEGKSLRLFVDKPSDWKSTDKRPGIVFYFGGGWVGGSPSQFARQSQYLASRGMVGVRVEYRTLGEDTKGPPTICCADAKSAMRYVRAHASELGIDPDRIAAAGGSAGGHLAAFTGLVAGLDDPKDDLSISCKPNSMVLFNPVLNNGPKQWGHERVGKRYREFSPAHNVTPGASPTIVFLGEADDLIPVSVIRDFATAMKQAGARCDAHFYAGAGHGFFNRDVAGHPWFSETLLETDKFLVSLGWLKGSPTLTVPTANTSSK